MEAFKRGKYITAILLAVMFVAALPFTALGMYDDSEPKDAYPVDPPVGLTLTYNGEEQIGVLTSEGSNYINYYGYDVQNYKATDAGTYTATAILWGDFGPQSFVWSDGTIADKKITFVIKKAANTMAVKGKAVKLKSSDVKKKAVKIQRKTAISLSKAQGTVTYKKTGGNSKISVNKKTGKITVGKGLKKGTYKVKIKVKAAGSKNYKALTKTVTVTIKIK